MQLSLQEIPWQKWPLGLTVGQVSTVMGVSRSTVGRLLENGTLEALEYKSVTRRQVTRASVVKALKLDV